MGNPQKKYHITDDGKIFSVMEDGSVSEIGNVSSLSADKKEVVQIEQPKSRKWMWIAIISWLVLIIACITFFVQHEDANGYISYLNSKNYDLEQNLSQVQSNLNTKTAELDSINQQIYREKQNRMPITVTGVQFANENQYSQLIENYGSELYSSNICYLKPRIFFTGRKNGTFNLTEKIYEPDGSLWHGTGSPENGTDRFSVNSHNGRDGVAEITSRGSNEPGCLYSGVWRFEVWYDDIKLYSTNFTVH